MKEVILCSHNPLLLKNLYGILRDEGYLVEIADHPALAVRMALKRNYSMVVIDSEPFGLSVHDAIRIIKTVLPEVLVIFVGYDKLETDALTIEAPIDLAKFKRAVHDLHHCTA